MARFIVAFSALMVSLAHAGPVLRVSCCCVYCIWWDNFQRLPFLTTRFAVNFPPCLQNRNLEGEIPEVPFVEGEDTRQELPDVRNLQTIFMENPDPSNVVCEDPGFTPAFDENTQVRVCVRVLFMFATPSLCTLMVMFLS